MKTKLRRLAVRSSILCAAVLGASSLVSSAIAAEAQIALPLHRTAYQTNEWIDVSVLRTDHAVLNAGSLALNIAGEDGSKLAFTFPVSAADVKDGDARRTEHLHLDGRLLRPGKYSVEVTVDGATASTSIEIFSHIRRSDFKLIDWGSSAQGKDLALLGEDSLGFNLIMYTRPSPDDMLRAGADVMRNCTMGGGHQMDLRMECDWSDPAALNGAESRVVNQALMDRTLSNCSGVHFYDEPGLSWWKDPKNDNLMVPFNLPSQDAQYRNAFGSEAPRWSDVKPTDAAAVARWEHLNRWKESFLEAAWKISAFGVSRVRGDFISCNQSQYGWMAYADGYYFNVARALPVISGHGGYDDGLGTYLLPAFYHEMGRIRDFNKPIWYMPTWYGETNDLYRCEQYMSFMTNLQGMSKPPPMQIQHPEKGKESFGIVESNKLMSRLGTIFNTMRPSKSPVALLYSLSQDLGAEVRDMQDHTKIGAAAYGGGDHVRVKTYAAYLAGKFIHQPLWPVVEEDVLDGSLAMNHKAVVLAGVDKLDAKVIAALETYITGGGLVIVSDDSKVEIKGATRLGVAAPTELAHKIDDLWRDKDQKGSFEMRKAEYWFKEVAPFAAALEQKLAPLHLDKPISADSPSVLTQKQGEGDIEYLFAVNATPKHGDSKNQIQSASVKLTLKGDARPVYDAIHGKAEETFKPAGDGLVGQFNFGPGQMRVFARTARPIGSVAVGSPTIYRDYTIADAPIRMEASAALLDDRHQLLVGSAPMRITLVDPLGQTRYDLYRATGRGTLAIDLPLAVNDPAGKWTLEVRELLSGHHAKSTFDFATPTSCAAAAGATHRAVFFGNDRQHIFELFRTHKDFTVVVGAGDYDAAVQRLVDTLRFWEVRCTVVKAADVKAHQPADDQVKSWSGLGFGRLDPTKPFRADQTGFEVRGPAILLGTPDDNVLIKFANDHKFLPYAYVKASGAPAAGAKAPTKAPAAGKPVEPAIDFPGRGRGYIAWQRDAVSYGNESITLIGSDAAGIDEAIGTMYEAAAGIDPMTQYALPLPGAVAAATKATQAPHAKVVWQTIVPDRVTSLSADANGVIAICADGSDVHLDAAGKITSSGHTDAEQDGMWKPVKAPAELSAALVRDRLVKLIVPGNGQTAVVYWGGTVQIIDATGATKALQVLRNDINGLAWQGNRAIVGLGDGTVMALEVK